MHTYIQLSEQNLMYVHSYIFTNTESYVRTFIYIYKHVKFISNMSFFLFIFKIYYNLCNEVFLIRNRNSLKSERALPKQTGSIQEKHLTKTYVIKF